jgi:hypothetical protein
MSGRARLSADVTDCADAAPAAAFDDLFERSLGEVQRRVRVIGRFPGEPSRLSLCWAVFDVVITGARSLGLSDLDREHLRAGF